MKTNFRIPSISLRDPVLLAALLLILPLAATAQNAPAASSSAPMDMSSMPGMDHGGMPGMTMPATAGSTKKPATNVPNKKAVKKHVPGQSTSSQDGMSGMDHGSMPGMPASAQPAAPAASSGDMPGMDHQAMPGMSPQGRKGMDHDAMSVTDHGSTQRTGQGSMGSTSGMSMGPMQGGNAPPNARSADYSDGIGYGSMKGMDMADNAPQGMLLIDRLEAFYGRDANGQNWEAQGWYGNDSNKLWFRTGGERSRGKLQDGDLEVFWNHNVAAFWNTQLGVRHDFGEGPRRNWAAFGVQGLAPYWFGVEATAYVGPSGRAAARARADYDLLFTQRLILQPELEANFYSKDDPARRIGNGLSDVQFGLRLRYEIRRQFAPYIGVNWVRSVGTTADYARQDGQPVLDRQIVVGVRMWF